MKRNQSTRTAVLTMLAISIGTITPAAADPCGMVPPPPPLELATSTTIERIGVQKTYVFHDRGMETMVLRPGFQGTVEEFGMLIPFPSPPAVRKVDDNIFSHIAAAIDPPEVIARVQRFERRRMAPRSMMKSATSSRSSAGAGERDLAFDEVRVVRQEAVGMYEVATLAAGSPKALKRWMDDNNFRYPDGMDEVVNDYVKSKWFFVAIKTNVGSKAGVNPHPGMRSASAKRPAGTTFNGFVQAMGFRFKTNDLVVPMRLSVFNAAGNARNIVYLLTAKPSKIKGIPEEFVKRQIPGKVLFQNVTNPLPLRVIGGTKKDLDAFQLSSLPARRDPKPHNGLAKELFGADLLAITSGRLSSPLEDKAKTLLNIGEALGLRGPVIDDLNRAEIHEESERLAARSLARLSRMTMSVIDGEFDRNVLAKQNLKFEGHRMASKENTKMMYDAIQQGPGVNLGGKVYRWEVASSESKPKPGWFGPFAGAPEQDRAASLAAVSGTGQGGGGPGPLSTALFLSMFGLGAVLVRRRKLHPALVAAALLLAGGGLATAQSASDLTRQLEAADGDAAVARVAAGGDEKLAELVVVATGQKHPIAAGRAVLAIVQIGTSNADAQLAKIIQTSTHSALLRTWAAAGRMQLAATSEELLALEPLSRSLPATRRPWVKRLSVLVQSGDAEDMLAIAARVPELQAEMSGALRALSSRKLLASMLSSQNQQVRQQAASFLGGKGDATGKLVANALRFDKNAKETPWQGGPLYMPGISWSKSDATAVANHLMRWMLWADKHDKSDELRIIANNLMSPAIAQAAGYTAPVGQLAYSVEYWLGMWTRQFGNKAVARMIADVK